MRCAWKTWGDRCSLSRLAMEVKSRVRRPVEREGELIEHRIEVEGGHRHLGHDHDRAVGQHANTSWVRCLIAAV